MRAGSTRSALLCAYLHTHTHACIYLTSNRTKRICFLSCVQDEKRGTHDIRNGVCACVNTSFTCTFFRITTRGLKPVCKMRSSSHTRRSFCRQKRNIHLFPYYKKNADRLIMGAFFNDTHTHLMLPTFFPHDTRNPLCCLKLVSTHKL